MEKGEGGEVILGIEETYWLIKEKEGEAFVFIWADGTRESTFVEMLRVVRTLEDDDDDVRGEEEGGRGMVELQDENCFEEVEQWTVWPMHLVTVC